MALSEPFTWSAVTISTSSKFISTGTTSSTPITTAGLYLFFLDTTNVAAGDEFEVGFTEKVLTGGTGRRIVIGRFIGAQPEPYMSPFLPILHGGDFDVIKKAGTDRAFDASLRQV